ncbi:class I SAM-dependent methyltransferase [Streptomyces sp. NPDC006385]|uniref:SAM-dependent methyltransferase n=1 Tax=Streptomyces sp. NPDC006385 TaxID=3156761 RepID=UPI0033B74419
MTDHWPDGVTVITGEGEDPYQWRVERTYADSPALWERVLGRDLWFQFGTYDASKPLTLDEAAARYMGQQLDLAHDGGLLEIPGRILDVGFGWGAGLAYLAERYPGCRRLDGVNVSPVQCQHAAERLRARALLDRVSLFQCNARDVHLLPDPELLYDLVVARGSITHFPNPVLETAMRGLAARTSEGAAVVISENLYDIPLAEYRSAVPDSVDRMACGNRKTPDYLCQVLDHSGFEVTDIRKLPSPGDAVRWLEEIKHNIATRLSLPLPGALAELRDQVENLLAAAQAGTISVYSVIAYRRPR